MKARRCLVNGLVLSLLVSQGVAKGEPLGTAFTFQGQLAQNGAPVTTGSADFIFELRDAEVGGNLVVVPAPLQNPLEVLDAELSATGALFTVALDFGAEAFNGEARWLAVSFRTPAGSGSYTPFDQRVSLTGTPYALKSLSSQWENNITNDIFFPAGLVGIGTESPTEELDVTGNIKATGTIQSGASIVVDGSLGNERISSTGSLEIYSAGNRVLRLEGEVLDPHSILSGTNVLGGWHGNSIAPGVSGATISGGGGTYFGAGLPNVVAGHWGTVGGGHGNTASGLWSTVAGGDNNTASGVSSFAAGRRAKANHNGTFVWADDTNADFASTGAKQFLIRASGGVGIGTANPQSMLHLHAVGQDNNGVSAPFRIISGNGAQNLLADGNEIDATADGLHLNNNTSQHILLANGGGNVGIGTTNPTFRLHLSTNSAAKPTSNTWTISSDERLKKNIDPIEGSLEKLLQLQGVTYQWIDPASQGGMEGTYTGMIAQDVEPVFPEWVSEGPDGYKSLTVIGFEALAIEALRDLRKEKDSQIESLRAENGAQRTEMQGLIARLESMEAVLNLINEKTGGAR